LLPELDVELELLLDELLELLLEEEEPVGVPAQPASALMVTNTRQAFFNAPNLL
jgi:hypothetical protein